MHYDTLILGGGIMGAATASALARQGQRVALIEQFEPGHSRGSSHGDGRIIRFAYPEPIYIEMALLAYPAWDAASARAGRPLTKKTGGWDSGPAGGTHLAELEQNFIAYGIPYERLSARESNARFPQFHLDEGSEAIYQADGGAVFATPAVMAFWADAQAADAECHTGMRITAIEPLADGVRLQSADGRRMEGDRLVVAAGGWAGPLLKSVDLDVPLVATREQVVYYLPADDAVDHRAGPMPVFIDYHFEDPFYGLPQIEIPGVKIGWHHTGPAVDADEPGAFDEAAIEGITAFVARRFPHLRPAPTTRLSCLYTNTPDYHFVLDRHPAYPHIVIGAGFSGHGFKFAPVIGDILAALATDQPPPVPLDTFALSRFGEQTLVRRTGA